MRYFLSIIVNIYFLTVVSDVTDKLSGYILFINTVHNSPIFCIKNLQRRKSKLYDKFF